MAKWKIYQMPRGALPNSKVPFSAHSSPKYPVKCCSITQRPHGIFHFWSKMTNLSPKNLKCNWWQIRNLSKIWEISSHLYQTLCEKKYRMFWNCIQKRPLFKCKIPFLFPNDSSCLVKLVSLHAPYFENCGLSFYMLVTPSPPPHKTWASALFS